jgi:RNA polymerase sigma factor (sigma-70 family)
MTSTSDDQQLIDSILAGDPRAWEKIVRRFSDMVWRILLGRFRLSKDDAFDVFQEIFLALQKDDFRRIRQWRGEVPLDAYMAVVLSRLTQDVLRAMRRNTEVVQNPPPDSEGRDLSRELPDPGPDPLIVMELAERRHAVNTCRERLGHRDQELIKLRYELALQYRGIADRLQMTVNNVGVSLSRAEERLRQCLQQHFRELFSNWGGAASATV